VIHRSGARVKSDYRNTQGALSWLQRGILGAACLLVVGIYMYTARSGCGLASSLDPATSYYNLLVQAFRAGQLNLKIDVPPELAQLPDPYDPAANSRFPVHDMSYYKGKLYLYFGPIPAIVLFWPYVALTGQYLAHKYAAAIFCALGFLASFGILWGLWRRYFAEVSVITVAACALTLGLATGGPAMLSRPEVYEVAISCGYMLTMLALASLWCALHRTTRRFLWLAGASLAYGLAVATRPSLLFGAVILLVPVVQALRRRQQIWLSLAAAIGPIALVGLGLMLYNALRFDDPFEFGQRYQLASYRALEQKFFGFSYLWFNFRVYFLQPARWTTRFPFVYEIALPAMPAGHYFVENPFGVLTNMPVTWLALAAPLALRGRLAEARSGLGSFLWAAALLFGTAAFVLCTFRGACLRYEVEFLPALLLLATTGILALERMLADRCLWRWAARWVFGVFIGFSIIFNLLASVAACAEAHNDLGGDLARLGKMPAAMAQWEQALRIRPDYAGVYLSLGNALLDAGKVNEAKTRYEQALYFRPHYAEAHNNLGVALMRLGRVPEAIAHFREALRINPDFVEAHFSLGSALEQSGKINEAARQYEQALRLRPDFAEAQQGLARVRAER